MDQHYNVLLKTSGKPSRLLALLALAFACALPFIVTHLFEKKQKKILSSTLASSHLERAPKPLSKPLIHPKNLENTKTSAIVVAADIPIAAPRLIWKSIITHKGESLISVLGRAGINAQTLHLIRQATLDLKPLNRLSPQQKIEFSLTNQTVEKVLVPFNLTQYVVIYRDGQHYKSKLNTRKKSTRHHFMTATIQGSLYSTAKKQHIPTSLIKQMIDIFTWDINFSKDVHSGDQLSLIYEDYYVDDKPVGTGNILAISYRMQRKTYQAIRHTSKNGQTDYFTPEGKSLKKAFLRFPLHFSHIGSTFSLSRYHPILHYRRIHKGIDLAAPIGTPITATGDGRIELIGQQNGYGNMIKINHQHLYTTIYAHMLRFQKGLSKGDFVKRGQVIGYVGQTGLASGPHCHYEFHINHQAKNPATVELPRSAPVNPRELGAFRSKTATLLAQLNLYETSKIAKATGKIGHTQKA